MSSSPRPGREPESPSVPPPPVSTFAEVLEAEWGEIRQRREVWGVGDRGDELEGREAAQEAGRPPENLVGLALSGGGIRSATFALGLLQRLAQLRVLRLVDYVSTVSGGGYVGGWWSAWLSREGRVPGEIFPPAERIEPERWAEYAAGGEEGGGSADQSASRNDPIHHLRLFSNYLTPRKGLLSADTWRGVTVVVRNLLLTWLVLLPLLLAAVVAGQVYFTLGVHPEHNFLRDFPAAEITAAAAAPRAAPPADAAADEEALARRAALLGEQAEAHARAERLTAIGERAAIAGRPLLVLLLWGGLLTLLWVVHGSGGGGRLFLATLAGAAAAAFIGLSLYRAIDETPGSWPLPPGWTYLLVVGAIVLVVACRALPLRMLLPRRRGAAVAEVPTDLLRNRVVRALSAVLLTLVVVAAVLLVAGFSHDLVWFLFDPASGGPLPTWVKQTGGWAAVMGTAAAMGFTGFLGAPAGGGGGDRQPPGPASRLVLAVAPVATLLLLAILAATAGRALLRRLGDTGADPDRIDAAMVVAIGLFLAFAVYEAFEEDRDDPRPAWRNAVAPLAAAGAGLAFWLLAPRANALTLGEVVLWSGAALGLLLIRWGGLVGRLRERAALNAASVPGSAEHREEASRRAARRLRLGALVLLSGGAWIAWRLADPRLATMPHIELRPEDWGAFVLTGEPNQVSVLLLAVALACGVFAAAEQLVAPSERRRALVLLTTALMALCARAVIPYLPFEADVLVYSSAAVTLIVLILAWVVGLGWMADPNLLSLHGFYRARLVRAYLGASNPRRRAQEITEAAPGDDLWMHGLRNCERGAPYPLVNTTLNLVGGGDLSTAQRSADNFLLSKHYCGSTRTGYRPTRGYMDGTLSLGTSVAISGAAASPNMGSLTPSGALSMLLALLNVRLAFWAPTPNRSMWRDARPRLWPFYLLREFLSQTNALSPYCSLSDGGHFDNSGLHALVARGCRFIVLSDCGADPRPAFSDLGNAIRRCRIDFGAEIDLRIDAFLPEDRQAARAHFVVGGITYSAAHARALGWPRWADPAERRGVVVWIKPSLTLRDEPADLRQYALENPVFPQQPTADQWYDEAQFESYRCLGEHIAQDVFGAAEVPEGCTPAEVQRFFQNLRAPEPASPRHFTIDVVTVDGGSALRVVEAPASAG